MGKKNKKLKKKKQYLPASEESILVETANPALPTETKEIASSPIHQADNQEFNYVRRDVKKILIIMVLIIVIIIALYFVDAKTTVLSSMGDWFYKLFNIQTQ